MPIILMNCCSIGAASGGRVTPQAFTTAFAAAVGDATGMGEAGTDVAVASFALGIGV